MDKLIVKNKNLKQQFLNSVKSLSKGTLWAIGMALYITVVGLFYFISTLFGGK